MRRNNKELELANYTLGDEVGRLFLPRVNLSRGAFSIVYKGYHRETGELRAIKLLSKRDMGKSGWTNLEREIGIMKKMNHPNVLKLFDHIETKKYVFLVFEYIEGGELFDQIVSRGKFQEVHAVNVVRQMLEGINYLHNMGVAHRDLKPENLLCSNIKDDHFRVVIADFGLAKVFGRGQLLKTQVGTPMYVSPEVARGEDTYDKAIDLWSAGVITYILLCGAFPFYNEDPQTLREQIIAVDYSFHPEQWGQVSDSGKDFIRRLLVDDPTKRMTSEEALNHPWLSPKCYHDTQDLRKSMENFQVKRSMLRESMDRMILD